MSARQSPAKTVSTLLMIVSATAACSDLSVLGPDGPQTASFSVEVAGETCDVLNFDDFAHGDIVTSVSLPLLNLSVAVDPSPRHDGRENPHDKARAFDTNEDPSVWEDTDLLWRQPGGLCAACEGQGRVLVIEHLLGFFTNSPRGKLGDAQHGGDITFSGFGAAPGQYRIDSFRAFDNDKVDAPMSVWVDGVQVGQASNLGDATVETVVAAPNSIASSIMFRLGTPEADSAIGSGGIDDIKICRLETLGDDGCTLGYWKTHLDSWAASGYDPDQTLESVFDVPDALGLDDTTLLAALSFAGGPGVAGAARILLRQAVAAVLNAAHPDVDYPQTAGSIIAEVNAALASGNRDTMIDLAEKLDAQNNLGCPLD